MKANEFISEKWSEKYKRSIDCNNPKGFSQKAHCAGREKTDEDEVNEIWGFAAGNRVPSWKRTRKVPKEKFDEPSIQQKLAARRKAAASGEKDAFRKSYDDLKTAKKDKEIAEATPEEEDKFHRELDRLVHNTFGASSDEKKKKTDEQLFFKGSPCTVDCSGHQAGYEWSQRKAGRVPNSWSPSFNNGAAIHRAGK